MGYIRKHKDGIRSAVEFTGILVFTIGLAPALMFLARIGHI